MASNIDDLSRRGRELHLFYPYGLLTPGTVFAHARKTETRRRLLDALKLATLDDVDHWRREVIQMGFDRFGESWDYLDNICLAHSFAELAQPKRVLEIGVRRGISTVAIAVGAPDAQLHCIDLWIPNYGNRPNPGPDAIKADLSAVGYRGAVEFYGGDSHKILPELFASHPELKFDLILVDGDHTESGALRDLRDVFPRLTPGGMLIFDDIAHPVHPYLLKLWRRCTAELGHRVRSAEYLDQGHGVAIAIRSTF